jgi:histone RNA hairpin-binding protein
LGEILVEENFMDIETSEDVLRRRRKQIEYGKNNPAYSRYSSLVPKEARVRGMPQTPEIHRKVSRRSFDAQVKYWKLAVHEWNRLTGGEGTG